MNIPFLVRTIILTLLFAIVSACSSPSSKTNSTSDGVKTQVEESSNLTWEEAKGRKARLSDVAYSLNVQLEMDKAAAPADKPEGTKPGEETQAVTDKMFTGQSRIEFTLKDTTTSLRLDFFEGEVTRMTANGQPIPATAKRKYWIEIPADLLKVGKNTIEVDYSQEYSRQGKGLHRTLDPLTKEAFTYTQFETSDAMRFMPCFDQPDLRSTLTMNVEAPSSWKVITTTRETRVKAVASGRKVWNFPITPSIATYLFSLHAGPYKVWEDKFEDIPLRVFARPSMAPYVRVTEWFTTTKQGLKYFNQYFNLRYPFKKYDQVFVPEFSAGAMENVAAVTFSERFLVRSTPTRMQKRDQANVLLHEMAHMWFGDIVTMAWWNDLWLNESFATFMATQAQAEATEFKEAWQDFYAGDKNWAYWEDDLVTTHPIEAPVTSTRDAFANFDGITYGKGASVLKQLNAYITPDAFKKGVQDYFAQHAYKNTTLADFIGALQGQTKSDLNLWADRWLRQAGTDKVVSKWTCKEGSLAAIQLATVPKRPAHFRPQAIRLALFDEKDGKLVNPQITSVNLTEAVQVVKGDWRCPAFVYPNYQDQGYMSVSLDAASLDYAKRNLSRIQDDLLRTMVWNDLWQMVRNTEMPLKDYIAIVNEHFSNEKNEILLSQIVNTISGLRGEEGTVLHYWPQAGERSQSERMAFIAKMEEQYYKRFEKSKAGSDEQKFWFDNYVAIGRTPRALGRMAKWSSQKNITTGFPLDVDRNWTLVRQLNRYDHTSATALIEAMKKRDPSERGQKQALSTEAIQPKMEVKRKWVDILKQTKPTVTFDEARSVLRALFPVEQQNLAKRFETDFYEYLERNGMSEDEVYVDAVAERMAPLNCDGTASRKLRTFIEDGSSKFSTQIAKTLKVELDEDERCQRIRSTSSL